ncbi:MAG: hypothetical protein ABI261_03275 [Ginsengibacter sp.]
MENSFIFSIVVMALVASFLFRKYIDSIRLGIIIRIVWLVVMMIIFFIFSIHHFDLAQNLTVGFVGVAALAYFLCRLKSIQ